MDLQLRGKRAFVSGSSSGLGEAMALELATEGCDVVVHGRDRKRTEAVAAAVEKLGVRAAATFGDLAEVSVAEKIAANALETFGGIDILVNNCGAVLRMDAPDWLDITPEEWIKSFEVNFMGGLVLAQAFAPGMKERKWGRIINISSTAGEQISGLLPSYGAPKAAVINFTGNISKSLGPHGVTVNTIIPGTHLTPAVERWLAALKEKHGWGDDEEENERIYTQELLPQSVRRLGRPREIAAAVAFLASPLSGYTNGASLRIDGGMARYI